MKNTPSIKNIIIFKIRAQTYKKPGQHQQKVIKTLDGEKIGSFLPEAELGSFGDFKEIN